MKSPDYSYELHQTLLKIENVNFTHGDTPILRNLNVELKNIVRPNMKQGQIVALLGPSGMGKTTLFRLLAGLESPQTGQILLGEAQTVAGRGEIGVVAQSYPLFAHRTVMGNLMVAGKQIGLKGDAAREKANDLLARFGLGEHGAKYPAQLSGGQRQRVAIAQQFMCSENFLLMDEPFSGLDILAQEAIIRFIAEIAAHDELMTFILVTHDISAAMQIADTIWVMGRERDEAGNPLPGANIQANLNLVERGLAWHENISAMPEFGELRQEIVDLFPRL